MFCAELEIFVRNDNCQSALSGWDSLGKESSSAMKIEGMVPADCFGMKVEAFPKAS